MLLVLGGFAVWNGYFILFEGLRQRPDAGQADRRHPGGHGHRATRSRFGAAAARNLLRVADFLPPPYLIGLLLVAFHPRGKRLGDLVAGTVVARDRPHEARRRAGAPAPARARPPSIPELDDEEFRLLSQFAARQARARARRRGPGSPPGSRPAGRPPAPRRARAIWPTCSRCTPPSSPAARAASRPGARPAPAPGSPRRSGERWDEFERLAERAAARRARQLRLARAARLRRPLPRGRRRPGPGPHLPRRRGHQARLERLAAAGHNALYRDERSTWRRLWVVLARECPAAVIQARAVRAGRLPHVLVPGRGGLHGAARAAGARRRAAARRHAPPRRGGAARKAAGRGYVDVAAEDRPLMASGIITNNVRVAIACFAGGIFLGVGSLVLLAYNGLAIGAFAGHFANVGLLDYLLTFILGHGALELFAIWVAGAAGFLLGRSVVAPGTLSRARRAGGERPAWRCGWWARPRCCWWWRG